MAGFATPGWHGGWRSQRLNGHREGLISARSNARLAAQVAVAFARLRANPG